MFYPVLYFAISIGLSGKSVSFTSFVVKKIQAILSFVGFVGNVSLKSASNHDNASAMTFLSPLMCTNVGPNSSIRSFHRMIQSDDIL